jgi:hypothetical protein
MLPLVGDHSHPNTLDGCLYENRMSLCVAVLRCKLPFFLDPNGPVELRNAETSTDITTKVPSDEVDAMRSCVPTDVFHDTQYEASA